MAELGPARLSGSRAGPGEHPPGPLHTRLPKYWRNFLRKHPVLSWEACVTAGKRRATEAEASLPQGWGSQVWVGPAFALPALGLARPDSPSVPRGQTSLEPRDGGATNRSTRTQVPSSSLGWAPGLGGVRQEGHRGPFRANSP